MAVVVCADPGLWHNANRRRALLAGERSAVAAIARDPAAPRASWQWLATLVVFGLGVLDARAEHGLTTTAATGLVCTALAARMLVGALGAGFRWWLRVLGIVEAVVLWLLGAGETLSNALR